MAVDIVKTIFARKPKVVQPPRVATDDVYPVHFFDDTKPFREMLLNWTLRFDDVLDADKLETALARLLEIGDWKKFGGRMRLTDDDRLELHVPQVFTPERPAIRTSHDVHDCSINDHEVAKHLPRTTSEPSIQPGVVNFYNLGARSDAPMTLEDLLSSDEPQIHLHIVSFNDATVIGLLFSHVLFGAAGMQSLVVNWSRVLAGREHEVPALCGSRQDILDDVGVASDPDKEPFILDHRHLKGLRHFRFTLQTVWDIFRRPEIESKILCLPAKFVSDLRARAMADLHAMDEKGLGGEEAPFVSEGDVLTAWWTRLVCTARGSKRSVTVLNAVDITGRLRSVFAPDKHYVQNVALGTWTILNSNEVVKAPLGYGARCFRYDIQTQTTPSQIMAYMRRLREGGRCGKQPLYGKPDSMLIIFTNWARCKFFECIDFSPAVIPRPADSEEATVVVVDTEEAVADKTSEDSEITSASSTGDPEKRAPEDTVTTEVLPPPLGRPPPGRLSYHHSLARTRTVLSRNVFTILGKDLQGNVWVSALGHPECWEHLEKAIAEAS
ncbi:lysr family regulatory protein [Colletotrichum truncatum]|uniref:Lysr family regulatory protein n=1 Tax=Colletotrichum truncatum TaxID=5467 RepID=A0ACC3Z6U1_COLTU|nr:lysr family regulatory protein [Colletotrichum truncatum]KAF6787963.1 lysr family regulatory protein [Colletotrichum truncatum]